MNKARCFDTAIDKSPGQNMYKRITARLLPGVFVLFSLVFSVGCATALSTNAQNASGFSGLSELTDIFSLELSNILTAKVIYLDRSSIRDTITKDVSNFSAYLQDELESSLSKKGFKIVYEPSEAKYLLGATYRKYDTTVGVFFKYHKTDGFDRKSANYEIELSMLPQDSFTRDLRSNARKLASEILSGQKNLKVYITPIRDGKSDVMSDFSKSFTSRIKAELVRVNRDVVIIDEVKAHKALSNTRGIKRKARKVKNLQNSDAFFSNADSVLEGQYFAGSDTVVVNLYLKMVDDGRVVSSSSVEIDKSLINFRLENKVQKKLTDLADTSTEKKRNHAVKISSTRGGDFPVYYKGEKIKFHIQVAKPLYVYVYDINSKGEVVLLYESKTGHRKLKPGRIYTIPYEEDEFDFEVEEPFGTDAVKIFASNVDLPIPELTRQVSSRSFEGNVRAIVRKRKNIQKQLSGMESINPKDLVDYFRGAAKKFDAELFEDSLLVETKARP